MRHKRLFIPGPTEVRAENLGALARPLIGHRSEEFRQLHASVVARLRRLMLTEKQVFLITSSATGVWEAAVRNCVRDRVLCCVQGAFSERWHQVAEANGKQADRLDVQWGQAIRAEAIERALSGGRYDAITVVHNETSTGVINDLPAIAAVMRDHPEVSFLVDVVSSLAGVPVEVDRLGIDVCLAGLQKALALPPGLAVASVSERAMEKAAGIENRGYYFDFLEMRKHAEKNQTPSTPAIPQIQALDAQLDAILDEGLERRHQRHAALAAIVQDWARRHFELFAQEACASPTVTCIRNTRGIPVAETNEKLGRLGATISNGYGRLKEQTFRIAHMGDTQEWEIRGLLETLSRILDL